MYRYGIMWLGMIASFSSLVADSIEKPHMLTADAWQEKQKNSDYFNAKKLADAPKMREQLITQEGFKEVAFKAADGVTLRGLLRTNPQARYTLVSFCGFFPGQKEGMATLISYFPVLLICSWLMRVGMVKAKAPL